MSTHSDRTQPSGDLSKREILTFIRTYLEVSLIIALSVLLYYSQRMVYDLQELRVRERDEGIKYWRELNERSAAIRNNSQELRDWEADLEKREKSLKKSNKTQ